ncbi:MAG: XdhC family protein [Solirubrobacterales bacterium]|nr:XdhC family protein [Solirubrobacterales bacterium]
MNDVLTEVTTWIDRGDKVALATVVGYQRSAPRPPGSKMAVSSRGEVAGSVSGGCVEGAVVEISDGVLRGEQPRLLHFGIPDSDAWDVGLPCGGEIDVWIQAYDRGRFAELAREGKRAAEVTLLEGARPGSKLLIEVGGERSGTLGAPEFDAEAVRIASELMWSGTSERRGPFFIDVVAPPPRLVAFGAVDVAAALCKLARAAGWRCYVVDPRARFATPERFPDAEEVIAAWPEEAFARLGGIDPATSIAVLTHDPKLDDAALQLALRSPARFIGAMGSRRAQAARRERLLAAGFTDDELTRLSAPLGLDLGASGREETALSILAEVVAARHGRGGGRLRDAQGRIHEVAA